MGRIEKGMLLAISAALIVLLVLMFSQSLAAENAARTYDVSVLVRAPSDRFRRGLEQAALDYNVDLHLVTSYSGAAQQGEYLQREVENDVDAIVIETESESALQSSLAELAPRTPVITVGLRPDDSGARLHVGVDDAQLGRELGGVIAAARKNVCLVITATEEPQYMKTRREALVESLIEERIPYIVYQYDLGRGPINLAADLYMPLPVTLAALHEDLLLPLCEQAREGDVVFGIGYAGNIRAHLEGGRIGALIVHSEYDAGYLSLREAVRCAEGAVGGDITLSLYEADAGNMYEEPMEQILFPIG